jgi:hypothetical protein
MPFKYILIIDNIMFGGIYLIKNSRKYVMLIALISLLLLSGVQVSAYQYSLKAVEILPIKNMEKTITVGESFSLPKSIDVKLSNGKTQKVDVIWNSNKINSKVVKKYTYTGKINGYKSKVVFVINIVNSGSIIKNIPDTKMTVKQNDIKFQPPEKVKAVMKNDEIKYVPVVWKYNFIRTSKVGTKVYEGSVENYKNKVKLVLTVIATEPDYSDLKPYKPEGWQMPAMATTLKDSNEQCDSFSTADEVYINYAFINSGVSETSIKPQINILVDDVLINTFEYDRTIKASESVKLTNISIGRLEQGNHQITIKLNDMFGTDTDKYSDNNEEDLSNNTYYFDVKVTQKMELSSEYYENKIGCYKIRIPSGWYFSNQEIDGDKGNIISEDIISLDKNDDENNVFIIFSYSGVTGIFDEQKISALSDITIQGLLTTTNKVTETNRQKYTIDTKDAYLIEYELEDSSGATTVSQKYVAIYTSQNDKLYFGFGCANETDGTDFFNLIKQSMLSLKPIN